MDDSRTVPASRSRSLVHVLLALVVLAALAAVLGREAGAPADPDAPALRLPTLPDGCGAAGPARAERARASEAAAGAKIARYPYAPAEGPRALQLLLQAERCFALTRRPRDAAIVAARARALGTRLQRDYNDQLIRYRGALAAGRPEQALQAIESLLELRGPERGAFDVRLQRLRRELTTHLQRESP